MFQNAMCLCPRPGSGCCPVSESTGPGALRNLVSAPLGLGREPLEGEAFAARRPLGWWRRRAPLSEPLPAVVPRDHVPRRGCGGGRSIGLRCGGRPSLGRHLPLRPRLDRPQPLRSQRLHLGCRLGRLCLEGGGALGESRLEVSASQLTARLPGGGEERGVSLSLDLST